MKYILKLKTYVMSYVCHEIVINIKIILLLAKVKVPNIILLWSEPQHCVDWFIVFA